MARAGLRPRPATGIRPTSATGLRKMHPAGNALGAGRYYRPAMGLHFAPLMIAAALVFAPLPNIPKKPLPKGATKHHKRSVLPKPKAAGHRLGRWPYRKTAGQRLGR